MSALAILLVLLSALFHALRSLFTKESGDKQVFLWLYSIIALLSFSPLFIYFLFRVGVTNSAAYAWCAGSGFIHFLYWIFLTLISVAFYSIVDKMAVNHIHPILFAFFHLFCGMCYYTPYILLTKKVDSIKKEWHSGSVRIIMAGVIGIIGYSMILIAFTIERVSYIVSLRQLSVVFAVLMGSFWLKEKHTAIRLSGAVIIFGGCFLISMAR